MRGVERKRQEDASEEEEWISDRYLIHRRATRTETKKSEKEIKDREVVKKGNNAALTPCARMRQRRGRRGRELDYRGAVEGGRGRCSEENKKITITSKKRSP